MGTCTRQKSTHTLFATTHIVAIEPGGFGLRGKIKVAIIFEAVHPTSMTHVVAIEPNGFGLRGKIKAVVIFEAIHPIATTCRGYRRDILSRDIRYLR